MRSLDTSDGLPPPYFVIQHRKKRRSRGEEIFLNKEELCQLQKINFAPLCRGNFFCSLPYFIRVRLWQNIWQFIYSICKASPIGNIQLLLGRQNPISMRVFRVFNHLIHRITTVDICLSLPAVSQNPESESSRKTPRTTYLRRNFKNLFRNPFSAA